MCFHKYGKIEQDGYQYCIHCGKAIHQCKWKYIREVAVYGYSNRKPESIKRIYECEICGEMKTEII